MIQKPLYHRDPAFGRGDTILIEVLESGDLKITTDPISGANHVSAESLLRGIAELAGGTNTRTRRRVTKSAQKQHQHIHGTN